MTEYLLGLLTGIFVGSAGTYYAQKFTDKRRGKEQKQALDSDFKFVAERMPELLEELKGDLKTYPLRREFVLLPKTASFGTNPNSPLFRYSFEDHTNLGDKVRILEDRGFVEDVAINDVPRYRMSQQFVDLLTRNG